MGGHNVIPEFLLRIEKVIYAMIDFEHGKLFYYRAV